jgi:hypothetical protein
MPRNIPTGQWIGVRVEHALWFAVGAYFAWFLPRRLRDALPVSARFFDHAQLPINNLC